LTIELFFATEENDNCVTQVHYIIQIMNEGTEPAPPFVINVFFDAPEPPDPESADQYKGISENVDVGLAVNDMYQVELWWKEDGGVKPGDYLSWLVVDMLDEVVELDETNNVFGPVHVKTEAIMCDPANLKVEKFTAGMYGDTIKYKAVVENDSEFDIVESFRLDLYRHRDSVPGYDDPGDANQVVAGLKAGESHEWVSNWSEPPNGCYDAYFVVDGDNKILETTEADNVAGPQTVVLCQDCQQCDESGEVVSPCMCGGEVACAGYCCGDTHSKKECPEIPVEPAGEPVVEPVQVELVEQVEEVSAPDLLSEQKAAEDTALSIEVGEEVVPAPDSVGQVDSKAASGNGSSGCGLMPFFPVGPCASTFLLMAIVALLLAVRRKSCLRR